jgi:hypothetical protein
VEALAARLSRPSARDLVVVLQALLRGGGEGEAAARLDDDPIDFRDAADAVAAAFTAAG